MHYVWSVAVSVILLITAAIPPAKYKKNLPSFRFLHPVDLFLFADRLWICKKQAKHA